MKCRQFLSVRLISILTLTVATCLCLTACVGNAPVSEEGVTLRDPVARSPVPTVDSPFAAREVQTPPDIAAYIQATGLAQTNRIEWYDTRIRDNRVITDTQIIEQVLQTLVSSASETTPSDTSFHEPILLVFYIPHEDDTRIVSMNFDPGSNRVIFANVATSSWPVDIRGQYTLVGGARLLTILGLG